MNEMKVYRALQTHAGNINALVVRLYNGELTAEAAVAAAREETAVLVTTIAEMETTDK